MTISRKTAFQAGLVAAAGAAMMALATPAAAAQDIYLERASMNTTFLANISGIGAVYSNGVTFRVNDVGTQAIYDSQDYFIYGFCIDIFHSMFINTDLNYKYTSTYGDTTQPLFTNYGPTAPDNVLSPAQIDAMTNLIDTGWILHQGDPSGYDTAMRTAAIQAAIWQVANPTRTISVMSNNLSGAQFTQYQQYFTDYSTGNYTSLADANDLVWTLTDTATNPQRQTFAVGWPIDVPEPGTWALMLLGFGAAGSALRRRRAAAA